MKYIIDAIIMLAFGAVIAIASFVGGSIGLGICGCVIFAVGVYQLVSEIVKRKKEDESEPEKLTPDYGTDDYRPKTH